MLSRQTKQQRGFIYNPLADADLTIFLNNGSRRSFILKAVPFEAGEAVARNNDNVRVTISECGQISVFVNGKLVNDRNARYSIKLRGNQRKKPFARI